MDIIKYSYDNQIFEIDSNMVPKGSLLDIIYRNSITDVIYSSDPNLSYVIWYVQNKPIINDKYTIDVLNYWGVYRMYDIIYADEKFMRLNLYNPEFDQHEINVNPYYRLRKMNTFSDEYVDFLEFYTKPDDLLFKSSSIIDIPSYQIVVDRLCNADFLFDLAHKSGVAIMIAGGSVFDMLMISDDSEYENEFNIHFINSRQDDIVNYIEAARHEIAQKFNQEHGLIWLQCTRTKYTISIGPRSELSNFIKVNFVLKMYRTYSEVLHSFDVDCLCVGWDGTDVWATERGRYALHHGFNTINIDLASPFYEYMLIKYGTKGVSIKVPDIEKYKIKDVQYKIGSVLSIDPPHINQLSAIIYNEEMYKRGRYAMGKSSDYELEKSKEYITIINYSYKHYIKGIYEHEQSEEYVELSQILHKQGITNPKELGPDYDIICNNPNRPYIFVIKHKIIRNNIITDLTISKEVYETMKVYGDIQLTRQVELSITETGCEITSIFGKSTYYDKDSWYIGAYVSAGS